MKDIELQAVRASNQLVNSDFIDCFRSRNQDDRVHLTVMRCAQCEVDGYSASARWCTKCGARFEDAGRASWRQIARVALFPFALAGRILSAPVRFRRERRRWLLEASGPDSPIEQVPGLSDRAKKVYRYLADVTYRFGSCNSRLRTIARVAGISESSARNAIGELERHRLLSHSRRNTWHARGANAYFIKPVSAERRRD